MTKTLDFSRTNENTILGPNGTIDSREICDEVEEKRPLSRADQQTFIIKDDESLERTPLQHDVPRKEKFLQKV
jgi:hypothetical protein